MNGNNSDCLTCTSYNNHTYKRYKTFNIRRSLVESKFQQKSNFAFVFLSFSQVHGSNTSSLPCCIQLSSQMSPDRLSTEVNLESNGAPIKKGQGLI